MNRVCFYWEEEVEATSIFILESVLDAIFALDIIFNFFTAYEDKTTDLLVTNPRLIALRYIKGFFFIDLIATIPFGTILAHSPLTVANKLGKLGRLPKMIRFAKAARLLVGLCLFSPSTRTIAPLSFPSLTHIFLICICRSFSGSTNYTTSLCGLKLSTTCIMALAG